MTPTRARLACLSSLLASGVALAQPPAAKPRASAPPRYASSVHKWHAPSDAPAVLDAMGRPELVLVSLNGGEHVELAASGAQGGFGASDLDHAAGVLRDTRSGDAHPVAPRLLDLAYAIQVHFQARELRVVSGYRTPRRGGGSNHGKGRAMDIVVPGAADADVAAYARTLGFVGVGIYPTSGFVHLDVRERSYFWSDASAPGRRNRERGILGDLAASSDKDAIARGDRPPTAGPLSFDVDGVLRARGGRAAPDPPTVEEEDIDDAPGAP